MYLFLLGSIFPVRQGQKYSHIYEYIIILYFMGIICTLLSYTGSFLTEPAKMMDMDLHSSILLGGDKMVHFVSFIYHLITYPPLIFSTALTSILRTASSIAVEVAVISLSTMSASSAFWISASLRRKSCREQSLISPTEYSTKVLHKTVSARQKKQEVTSHGISITVTTLSSSPYLDIYVISYIYIEVNRSHG